MDQTEKRLTYEAGSCPVFQFCVMDAGWSITRLVYFANPIFDDAFSVNNAFNAEVFGAPPHAIVMKFDSAREEAEGYIG